MFEWVIDNKWVLLFYLILIVIIYANRKKFEFQAKFIAMFKTKLGLKLMDKISQKYREYVKLFGYIGVGIGFIGMLFIFGTLVYLLFGLIVTPETTQGVSLVIPGFKMAGSDFRFPLVYGLLSIFVIATIHELAHGIVARAWRIPILSSGIVFFGPIIGAFVEPDDKKMSKRPDIEQYSVFAAGPFINILFAFLLLAMLLVSLPFINNAFYENVIITDVAINSPAYIAGWPSNSILTDIDNTEITDIKDLSYALSEIESGDNLNVKYIHENKEYQKTIEIGEKDSRPYIGIYAQSDIKYKTGLGNIWFKITSWIFGDSRKSGLASWGFLSWLMNLSLAIGLINLLPLGPTDGGRMIFLATQRIYKQKGAKIYSYVSFISLMLLLACLLLSYAKPLFM